MMSLPQENRLLARSLAISVLVLAMLGGGLAPSLAQELQILPVDEAAADASWVRFKKRLIGAIEKRDKQFILSILDKNVRNQMEKARGVAAFRKQWELDAPDTPLWRELASALQLGGAYFKRDEKTAELCSPYLLAKWPEDVEPFTHGAIVARATTVQAEPSTASSALGQLSYHVVPVLDWEVADKATGVNQKWVRIRYSDSEGYVPEEHVRSPIEQVACFAKSGATWRMTAFAPAGGDYRSSSRRRWRPVNEQRETKVSLRNLPFLWRSTDRRAALDRRKRGYGEEPWVPLCSFTATSR